MSRKRFATLSCSTPQWLAKGDKVTIGTWPRWTRHFPTLRRGIRWITEVMDWRHFGPTDVTVTHVSSNSEVTFTQEGRE